MRFKQRRTIPEAPRLNVAILAAPTALALEIVGPAEVFAMANRRLLETKRSRSPRYDVEILSTEKDLVLQTASGIALSMHKIYPDARGPIDTLLVADGMNPWKRGSNPGVLRWLQRQAAVARRVSSVCTGSFLLAEAGLLEGHRVTTHWAFCDELQRRYPSIHVDPNPIYIRDGKISTSAGVSTGIDLALAFVEEDLGTEVALYVARALVLFLRRSQGQQQFSTSLAFQEAARIPLREMPIYILENLSADLSVPALAARVAMSPRNFSRIFLAEIGEPPASFVWRLRLETAWRLIRESDRSIEEIAASCGWGDKSSFSRAFKRKYRQTPGGLRSTSTTPV